MKTLVTGGAGFIGSHLVEQLLRDGDEVTVLDDMSTGTPRNLAAVVSHPRLRLSYGSVLDARTVRAAMTGCDRVFHLAALVGVKLIVEEPLRGLHTNIGGTENVLRTASELGVGVLLVSTSEVYGKNTADRLDEDADRILGPTTTARWSYAAAKGIDEAYAHAYAASEGLDVTMVRLFNTVGRRQTGRYGMVVPNLVGQALRGTPLTVFGDGEQTRCFTSVTDVVPALVRLEREPRARGMVFNLGNPREISILDLARLVIRELGSSSSIEFVPYEWAYAEGFEDMRRRVPDIARAREVIGFDPTTPLVTIIHEVADDLRSRDRIGDEVMPLARTGGLAAADAVAGVAAGDR